MEDLRAVLLSVRGLILVSFLDLTLGNVQTLPCLGKALVSYSQSSEGTW